MSSALARIPVRRGLGAHPARRVEEPRLHRSFAPSIAASHPYCRTRGRQESVAVEALHLVAGVAMVTGVQLVELKPDCSISLNE
jgi:hypothetical protein